MTTSSHDIGASFRSCVPRQPTHKRPWLVFPNKRGSRSGLNEILRHGRDQCDRLYLDGAKASVVRAISVHSHLTGVPHRIKYLETLHGYILGHDGVVRGLATRSSTGIAPKWRGCTGAGLTVPPIYDGVEMTSTLSALIGARRSLIHGGNPDDASAAHFRALRRRSFSWAFSH